METFSALLALCAGNSPVPVNSPHKGQWRGALMFSLIYAWINDWVNNREAGDLRRQRGHYDVIVMLTVPLTVPWGSHSPISNRKFRQSHLGKVHHEMRTHTRWLILKFRVGKPRDMCLVFPNRSKIWQTPQHCSCRCVPVKVHSDVIKESLDLVL